MPNNNSRRSDTTSTLPAHRSRGPVLWGTGAGRGVRPLGQPSCHTHDHAVLAHVNVRADLSCVDHTVLLNENVVPDVQREERDTAGREDEQGKREVKAERRSGLAELQAVIRTVAPCLRKTVPSKERILGLEKGFDVGDERDCELKIRNIRPRNVQGNSKAEKARLSELKELAPSKNE